MLNKDNQLTADIKNLLERKIRGDELSLEPRIESINKFLDDEMERLMLFAKSLPKTTIDPTSKLNSLFHETLDEVWGLKL